MSFRWRGSGLPEIFTVGPLNLVYVVWVGHWCQANAKWQTGTNLIFETRGTGLSGSRADWGRGLLFVFVLPVFCCLTLPIFFPSSDHPPFFLFLLVFSPSFHSCFSLFLFFFASLFLCPSLPSLLDWLSPRAAISNGAYLLFSDQVLAVKSWLLGWFL